MSRHEAPMINKVRYESLVYETLYDVLIGDALTNILCNYKHGTLVKHINKEILS
jgi:hypothetical protein